MHGLCFHFQYCAVDEVIQVLFLCGFSLLWFRQNPLGSVLLQCMQCPDCFGCFFQDVSLIRDAISRLDVTLSKKVLYIHAKGAQTKATNCSEMMRQVSPFDFIIIVRGLGPICGISGNVIWYLPKKTPQKLNAWCFLWCQSIENLSKISGTSYSAPCLVWIHHMMLDIIQSDCVMHHNHRSYHYHFCYCLVTYHSLSLIYDISITSGGN